MNIDIKDVITLSNNIKYIVSSKASLDGKTYYLLVNIDNISDFKIFYLDNNDMVVSKDEDVNDKLFPLFYENNRSDEDIINVLKELIEKE